MIFNILMILKNIFQFDFFFILAEQYLLNVQNEKAPLAEALSLGLVSLHFL